jgi:hypothetical protein
MAKQQAIHIHNKLYIALSDDGCWSDALANRNFEDYNLFSPMETFLASDRQANERNKTQFDDSIMNIFGLSDIFLFDDIMKSELAKNSFGFKQLVNIGSDPVTQARSSFLLGCHLIMSHGLGFEETFLSLRPLHALFDQFSQMENISLENSLRAFCCAKCLNWIDFRISTENDIQIDRFVHDVRWS